MQPKRGENLLVLYGSQTGTAEDVAERIARQGMGFGLKSKVGAMDEWTIEQLIKESGCGGVVVFVAATTGQGDTPENMKGFWKELCRAKWGNDLFDGMKYGVIGLGDSSYEKYNFVGKKLFRRLRQLGGRAVMDLCLGDDQHDLGYHAAVAPWIEKFFTLCEGMGWKIEKKEKGMLISKFELDEGGDGLEVYGGRMRMRRILENVRVTATSHWQDTRLISVDLEGSDIIFNPGDVLTVQPSNHPENVERFFEIFGGLKNSQPISIRKNPSLPWSKISMELLQVMGPQPWTWENIVQHFLDIQSVPKLYFFELISNFATNELEKEKLLEFCTPQGQEDLFSYCNRPKRNILEVLEDFPNTTKNIPSIFLFDLIPAIKPRSFSIASSRRQFPNQLQILVSVVEYQTKIKAKRKGLCSNWLAHHCQEGSFIPVWIQKGSLTFPPPDENTHVIMIGPGTGVAPFRSVINERLASWNKWLFFGCRNENFDFYFENEWRYLENAKLLKFRPAFSRNLNGDKRDYVQDKIIQSGPELGKILRSKNFYIFVAGNAKQMPKDVQNAIVQLMKQNGITDAEAYMENCWKKLGRYQTETWS